MSLKVTGGTAMLEVQGTNGRKTTVLISCVMGQWEWMAYWPFDCSGNARLRESGSSKTWAEAYRAGMRAAERVLPTSPQKKAKERRTKEAQP